MVAITTRAGKGSPLTNAEVDANFTNLNAGIAAVPVGDVVGPAGATDNFIPRWDTATGKLLQSSLWQITDAGHVLPFADNTYDIGAPASRVRTGWFGTLGATDVNATGTLSVPIVNLVRSGASPSLYAYQTGGTTAVPGPTLAFNALLDIRAFGRGTTGTGAGGGGIVIFASENWTDANQGTAINFRTTSNLTNALTDRWQMVPAGHFVPNANNTYDLGTTAVRVRQVYGVTGDFSGTMFAGNLVANTGVVQSLGTGAGGVFDGLRINAGSTSVKGFENVATFRARGWAGAAYAVGAIMAFDAAADWSATSAPTNIDFATTPVGSITPTFRWQISFDGHVIPFTTNAHDIGATASRARTLYATDGDFSAAVKATFADLIRYGSTPSIYSYQSGGTVGVPVPTAQYELMFLLAAKGRAPSGFGVGGGALFFQSSEAWTNTAQGTNFQIQTTSIGTTNPVARWQVDHNGDFKPMTDNVYDLGNAGTRPRNVWGSVGDFALSVYARAAGAGGIQLNVGSTVNTGYLAFFAPDGVTRAGYFGFGDNATKTLQFVNEAGYSWKFAADLIVVGEVYFGGGLDKIEPRGKYWALATPTGAAYTLVLADQGKFFYPNSASAQVITIPANSAVAFPNGTRIDFVQWGAGQVSFTPDTGVVLNSPGAKRKLNVQYSAASLTKVGTNSWLLSGDIVT